MGVGPDRRAIGLAAGYLVLSVVQLVALGNTDHEGGWVNGLHGLLALVVLIGAGIAFHHARRSLAQLGGR